MGVTTVLVTSNSMCRYPSLSHPLVGQSVWYPRVCCPPPPMFGFGCGDSNASMSAAPAFRLQPPPRRPAYSVQMAACQRRKPARRPPHHAAVLKPPSRLDHGPGAGAPAKLDGTRRFDAGGLSTQLPPCVPARRVTKRTILDVHLLCEDRVEEAWVSRLCIYWHPRNPHRSML